MYEIFAVEYSAINNRSMKDFLASFESPGDTFAKSVIRYLRPSNLN